MIVNELIRQKMAEKTRRIIISNRRDHANQDLPGLVYQQYDQG